MTNVLEFNKKYTDDKAKDYRQQISKLMFDIEFFSLRIKQLQDEVNSIQKEYFTFLGVNDNGKDEKK